MFLSYVSILPTAAPGLALLDHFAVFSHTQCIMFNDLKINYNSEPLWPPEVWRGIQRERTLFSTQPAASSSLNSDWAKAVICSYAAQTLSFHFFFLSLSDAFHLLVPRTSDSLSLLHKQVILYSSGWCSALCCTDFLKIIIIIISVPQTVNTMWRKHGGWKGKT